jgi:hypothetical protein
MYKPFAMAVTNKTIRDILLWAFWGGIVTIFVFYVIMSFVQREFDFVIQHADMFILETIVISILTTTGFLIVFYTRKMQYKNMPAFALAFFLKLVFIHVLLEASGTYYMLSTGTL